jgi:hypothetical protein
MRVQRLLMRVHERYAMLSDQCCFRVLRRFKYTVCWAPRQCWTAAFLSLQRSHADLPPALPCPHRCRGEDRPVDSAAPRKRRGHAGAALHQEPALRCGELLRTAAQLVATARALHCNLLHCNPVIPQQPCTPCTHCLAIHSSRSAAPPAGLLHHQPLITHSALAPST